jgi:flagellin FlaB
MPGAGTFLHRLRRDQRGITGLETAIILIAFVVVASVFAYTVLTAGIFSSQKSSEAVHTGLTEARSSIVLRAGTLGFMDAVDIDGSTLTADGVNAVTKISLTVGVALQGTSVDLTPSYRVNPATGYLEASGLANTFVVNYLDDRQHLANIAWTLGFSGANDGDYSLEGTERAVLTIWLVDYRYDPVAGLYYTLGDDDTDPFIDGQNNLLGSTRAFTIELLPPVGAPVSIEKIVPQGLNPVMDLH